MKILPSFVKKTQEESATSEASLDSTNQVNSEIVTPAAGEEKNPVSDITGDIVESAAAGATVGAFGMLGALKAFTVLLASMGFTAEGIAAGSVAASMMSAQAVASGTGGVVTGGTVATLQSIGAAGLSFLPVAGMAAAGAAIGGGAALIAHGLPAPFWRESDDPQVSCGQKSDTMITALRPGNVIALHSPVHNRFIRVMGEDVNGYSGQRNLDNLPSGWESERLTIVDAGDGEVALYSVMHRRFVRLYMSNVDARGGEVDMNDPPRRSERFAIMDAGKGKIALYSKFHDRLVRMNELGEVDAEGTLGISDFSSNEAWEVFSVLLLSEKEEREVAWSTTIYDIFMRIKGNGVVKQIDSK